MKRFFILFFILVTILLNSQNMVGFYHSKHIIENQQDNSIIGYFTYMEVSNTGSCKLFMFISAQVNDRMIYASFIDIIADKVTRISGDNTDEFKSCFETSKSASYQIKKNQFIIKNSNFDMYIFENKIVWFLEKDIAEIIGINQIEFEKID